MFIVAHYSEIALKKGNRKFFEQKLKNNILKSLKIYKPKAHLSFGRILVELRNIKPLKQKEIFNNEVIPTIRRIFGVSNFALAFNNELTSIPQLGKQVLNKLKEFSTDKVISFRILATRADKNFSLSSQEVNEKLWTILQKELNIAVKLNNPDLTVFVEILQKEKHKKNNDILFYFNKYQGAGGLPIGTSGNVIGMISGGIDSPVACFKIMRRGAKIIFLHFHSYPYTNKSSQKIVEKLVKKLALWQDKSKLYFVSLADIQNYILVNAPEKLRVILYRRSMIRICNDIALKEKADAIVTGDNLGQVASQTLENIKVIDNSSALPIFRPLIGDDKQGIIKEAKNIETYDISIEPHADCCSVFVPKHPETKAKLSDVLEVEKKLKLDKLEKQAIDKIELKTII
ncbi:MAG: tRNA uracil 4-sulfurtransferase ThiI [Patescibacteria group bacterium]